MTMTDCQTTTSRSAERTKKIRELNDGFRATGIGGRINVTGGIGELGLAERGAIFTAVATFADFNPGNDPHGEHDCASLEVNGRQIIWKIDYYDPSYLYHSEDEADPAVTRRVLVIMLAEEY
jgi:hypothetical protein